MQEECAVFCADIGSVAKGRFGWAFAPDRSGVAVEHDDIEELVTTVVRQLLDSKKVALGFECPLFVPIPSDPLQLTSARVGEGAYPWSAGAGASALATGLLSGSLIEAHT